LKSSAVGPTAVAMEVSNTNGVSPSSKRALAVPEVIALRSSADVCTGSAGGRGGGGDSGGGSGGRGGSGGSVGSGGGESGESRRGVGAETAVLFEMNAPSLAVRVPSAATPPP
jgi:hypothetical protein